MRGYSIVEIVLVVGIMAVLLVIGTTAYSAYLNRQRLLKSVEAVVTLVQKARTSSSSSYNSAVGATSGKQYCVQLNKSTDPFPNKIILNDESGIEQESYTTGEGVIVSNVAVAPTPDNREVCFRRLSGDAFVKVSGVITSLVSADITLYSQNSLESRTISILPTGVVQVQ